MHKYNEPVSHHIMPVIRTPPKVNFTDIEAMKRENPSLTPEFLEMMRRNNVQAELQLARQEGRQPNVDAADLPPNYHFNQRQKEIHQQAVAEKKSRTRRHTSGGVEYGGTDTEWVEEQRARTRSYGTQRPDNDNVQTTRPSGRASQPNTQSTQPTAQTTPSNTAASQSTAQTTRPNPRASQYNGPTSDFASTMRKNSRTGSVKSETLKVTGSWSGNGDYDWRVRLMVPSSGPFDGSPLLDPLWETDNSMVWPYTPSIIVTNTATYNSLNPTHNNYTYPAYQNSSIEQITITGEFTVETPEEAKYWVAASHFLRSITKMFYGESDNAGAPPPVTHLNGYGDFVFNNVPVVVESFMMNLPKDVDYIRADVGQNGSWVPTLSEISVTVRTAYSRSAVNEFDMTTFVNGGYLGKSTPGFM